MILIGAKWEDPDDHFVRAWLLSLAVFEVIFSLMGDYVIYAYVHLFLKDHSKWSYVVPIDLHTFSERFALIVFVVMGESLVQLLTNLPDFKYARGTYLFLTGGIALIFFLAQNYFNYCQYKDLSGHAARISIHFGFWWGFLHLPLCIFVLFIGFGFKESFKAITKYGVDDDDIGYKLFAVNTGCASILMTIMRYLHNSPPTWREYINKRGLPFLTALCWYALHFIALTFPKSFTRRPVYIWYHVFVAIAKSLYDAHAREVRLNKKRESMREQKTKGTHGQGH